MKWIEIITLRSFGKNNTQMIDELLHQISQQKESGRPASISVYSHSIIETDLSVHINWEAQEQHPGASSLGQRIAHALKTLGQLNHSIWIEVDANDNR